MKNNLPVFPLGLVALPGSIQSLQIFEPRYLKMIKKCMSDVELPNEQWFELTSGVKSKSESPKRIKKETTSSSTIQGRVLLCVSL